MHTNDHTHKQDIAKQRTTLADRRKTQDALSKSMHDLHEPRTDAQAATSRGGERVRSHSVDPSAFENSLEPELSGAARRVAMFDYNGGAPISRRTLGMLPLQPHHKHIIQSPVGSPMPSDHARRSKGGGDAWRRTPVASSALVLPKTPRGGL